MKVYRPLVALAAAVVMFAIVWNATPPQADHPSIDDELNHVHIVQYGAAAGETATTAEELRAEFISQYNKTRAVKLSKVHRCEACGRTVSQLQKIGGHLETHHVISVERIWLEGLDRGLISDENNLIVLCRCKGGGCHFLVGHDPDGPGPAHPDFKKSNPNVRRDAAKALAKTQQAI